ncbi:MAG TPA: zf-HC2 domain-containing protein [Candidatus Acidoferrum sp.]|nr:zf-HC2 domain-containing protein [Candidatus Acidoferrum sp.]
MSCERMEGRLVAYLDGRAKDSDRRAVESHIAGCAACRARVQGFHGVWDMLGELPEHEPSPAFDVRLRARLATEPVHQGFWSGVLPSPRFAMAVTVLALFCVWLSSRPISTPTNASNEADFRMIQDLPVLENYDFLSSFDVPQPAPPPLRD